MESTTGYTFTPCVVFYFPWHRHQIEGTNGFYCLIRKTERFTISNVESQVFTPNNSRLPRGLGRVQIECPTTGPRRLSDHGASVSWVGKVTTRCQLSLASKGPICLGRNHSQIYPHMPAKFGHDWCRIASARSEIRDIVRTRLL